jgi:prepilin-type N-terminal cleavage/methylation domain-containing protein
MTSIQTATPRRGFTLLEIMVAIAIISLLAALGIPNYLRNRKRNQAVRVLDGARALEQAMNLYAIEHNVPGSRIVMPGDEVNFIPYIKTGSQLAISLPNDLLGNPYSMTTLDTPPKISTATYNALSDVTPIEFWTPYYP